MSYPFPPTVGAYSPWGLVQSATPLGPDAVLVSTPSHGGIRVSGRALSDIPQALRSTAYSQGGWFEEDCDWAIPYLALGLHRFEAEPGRGERLLEAARRTAWTYHRAHAALLGVPADPALVEGIGRQEGRCAPCRCRLASWSPSDGGRKRGGRREGSAGRSGAGRQAPGGFRDEGD